MKERGNITNFGAKENIKASNLNFAFLLKNSLSESIYTSISEELLMVENLEMIDVLLSKEFSREYYSVGEPEEGKLSLSEYDGYLVEYMFEGQRKVIANEKNMANAVRRFYNELLYYRQFIDDIKRYENVFGEKFSDKEIVNLINY